MQFSTAFQAGVVQGQRMGCAGGVREARAVELKGWVVWWGQEGQCSVQDWTACNFLVFSLTAFHDSVRVC
jgi:hypothetical protein